MKQTIKCGTSCNGMVLTDMPLEMLKAMRDSIDEAIKQYQDNEADKYATDIQAAIDAAREAGYEVLINGIECDEETAVDVFNENEDW